MSVIYCIDTSVLISINNNYPQDIFGKLWDNIENAIQNGMIVSTKEVYNELIEYDDDLSKWAKTKKELFIELDESQQLIVKDILSKFPTLVDANKPKTDADPFIIALAKNRNLTVLTIEKSSNFNSNPNARPKIPDVCEHYGIGFINNLPGFFRKMGWKF